MDVHSINMYVRSVSYHIKIPCEVPLTKNIRQQMLRVWRQRSRWKSGTVWLQIILMASLTPETFVKLLPLECISIRLTGYSDSGRPVFLAKIQRKVCKALSWSPWFKTYLGVSGKTKKPNIAKSDKKELISIKTRQEANFMPHNMASVCQGTITEARAKIKNKTLKRLKISIQKSYPLRRPETPAESPIQGWHA